MILKIKQLSDKGEGVVLLGNSKAYFSYLLPYDEIDFDLLKIENKLLNNNKNIIKINYDNLSKLAAGYYNLKINSVKKSDINRKDAKCPYYERCGGCSLQHFSDEFYYSFKTRIFLNAILKACGTNCSFTKNVRATKEEKSNFDNFDKDLICCFEKNYLIKIRESSRRRAVFKVKDKKLGFFAKESNDLIEINKCPLLHDEINDIIFDLSVLVKKISVDITEIFVSLFDNGLAVVFRSNKDFNIKDFDKIKLFADKNNIISISNNNTIIYQTITPMIYIDNIKLKVPNDIFMQGTKEGQKAITDIIKKNIEGSNKVLDLYSGIGGYGFSLAGIVKKITAVEGEINMVNSIKHNVIDNSLNGKFDAEYRNLFSNPMLPNELNKYDGIIINPPRNGAGPQCKNIAKSGVKKIIMVSCNPETFTNDVRILIGGGYELIKAFAIDQFYWTPHLEIVGIFEK